MKAAKEFFSRIDLKGIDIAAILIGLLGLCQFLALVGVMVATDVAKLITVFWASQDHHWFAIIFGVAVAWLAIRWKKLNS